MAGALVPWPAKKEKEMLIELLLVLAAIELVAYLIDPRERRLRALLREVGREDNEH